MPWLPWKCLPNDWFVIVVDSKHSKENSAHFEDNQKQFENLDEDSYLFKHTTQINIYKSRTKTKTMKQNMRTYEKTSIHCKYINQSKQ